MNSSAARGGGATATVHTKITIFKKSQTNQKQYKQILKKIKKIIITNRNLRFKIPLKFEELLKNKIIKKVTRFSKYLILNFYDESFCLIHLGMSGTVHLIKKNNIGRLTNTSFKN